MRRLQISQSNSKLGTIQVRYTHRFIHRDSSLGEEETVAIEGGPKRSDPTGQLLVLRGADYRTSKVNEMPDKLYSLSCQAQIPLVDIRLREGFAMVNFEPNPTASLFQFGHYPLQISDSFQ